MAAKSQQDANIAADIVVERICGKRCTKQDSSLREVCVYAAYDDIDARLPKIPLPPEESRVNLKELHMRQHSRFAALAARAHVESVHVMPPPTVPAGPCSVAVFVTRSNADLGLATPD